MNFKQMQNVRIVLLLQLYQNQKSTESMRAREHRPAVFSEFSRSYILVVRIVDCHVAKRESFGRCIIASSELITYNIFSVSTSLIDILGWYRIARSLD